jgi:hypothetical protein
VEKEDLIRKLSGLLDDAKNARQWGNIDIEIRDGQPVVIRRSYTDKLTEDNNRGQRNFPRT